MAANPGTIQNANLIYVGTSINLPSGAGGGAPSTQNKIPDPSLYTVNFSGVDMSPEHIAQLEDKAYNELAPYYQRLLDESNGDVELAKQRLQEDYNNNVRIKTEDVATAIKYATEDTGTQQGLNADKLKMAKETLKYLDTTKFPAARQALLGTFNSRGLFNSGLKIKGVVDQSASQALERTGAVNDVTAYDTQSRILDTALARTVSGQNLSLDRTKAADALSLSRGTTDLTTDQKRKQADLEQKRRQEAVGIAQSRIGQEVNLAKTKNAFGTGG
jgi:hypothetical protein